MSENRAEQLSLYLRYEEYLSAEQVASILSLLDQLYESLYPAFVPAAVLPLPQQSRLRVNQVSTGRSIELLLADGIRELFHAGGPLITVSTVAGVAAFAGKLIIGAAKGGMEALKTFNDVKKSGYDSKTAEVELEKSKVELEKARIELEARRLEAERERQLQREQPRGQERATEPLYFNDEIERRAMSQALALVMLFYYAPNITQVQINGRMIIDKAGQRDTRHG